MDRFKLFLLGRLMVWFARREGATEAEIDSGVTVVTVDEMKALIAAPPDRKQEK